MDIGILVCLFSALAMGVDATGLGHKPTKYMGNYRRRPGDSHFKIVYQYGNSDADLPECGEKAVCNKLDLYEYNSPWLEKKCRCRGDQRCPATDDPNDGYTIVNRHRQYKLCEPIKKLPKCKYFRDITWTYISTPDNFTQQIMHCHCPKNSVTYLLQPLAYHTPKGLEYRYMFACSPPTKLLCQRKEPCKLFTVRKRQQSLEEVNTSTICQCPKTFKCPHKHTDYGVLSGKIYLEDSVRTYSGFCLPT